MKKKLLALTFILMVFLSTACNNVENNMSFGKISKNNYINSWVNLKLIIGSGWEPVSYDILNKMSFPNEHVNLVGISSSSDVECVNGLGAKEDFLKNKNIFYARPFALNYKNEASIVFEIFKKKSDYHYLKNVDDFVSFLAEQLKSSSLVTDFNITNVNDENIKGIDFSKFSADINYGFPEKLYVDYYIKSVDGFFMLIMMNHYRHTEDVLDGFVNNNIEIFDAMK